MKIDNRTVPQNERLSSQVKEAMAMGVPFRKAVAMDGLSPAKALNVKVKAPK